ncbi:MAG: M20/M25/M40 family metallo-hydrolase [Acidobacteria bacterium]|nr:M20/M25/M40 family metallo-hydrolase [Acidobacteriota bacterium]MCL5287861.1 M20/M25/M40 family metallo-hydrolase [Acidobacteriota bacterium]
MTSLTAQSAAAVPTPAPQLAQESRVARALAWLDRNADWATEQQIRITETAAPPFGEVQRGILVKKLLEETGLKCRTDEAGNVVCERPGTKGKREPKDVVLISAHLDTVFPPGTNVRVTKERGRLLAPGISDNGCGLVALVAVARAVHEARVRTRGTIVFAANVGEEGEGNLRGMRKLMETYRGRLRAVIAIDGASSDHVTTMALASRRIEAVVEGPGGHSWADFGLPNPIHALGRGVARFVKVKVPENPRTSFNVGLIDGGTSVNSIPHHATMKVDLRSESDAELDRLENALREALQTGVEEEMAAARERGAVHDSADLLKLKINVIGARPGGELPENSFLLEAVRSADRYVGQRSRLERSSTDANIPLSLGIPAIALGGGGRGGGAHSLNEWYEPAGRETGLKRILLTLLSVAGVEE